MISISVMLKTSSLLVTEAVNELEPAADVPDAETDAFTFEGDCGTSGFWSGGRESAWKSEEAVPLHLPASAGSESRKYSDEAERLKSLHQIQHPNYKYVKAGYIIRPKI